MRKLSWVFVALCATAVVAAQAGFAGKWAGETQGRQGPQTVTLELAMKGQMLAGTYTQGQQPPSELSNVKVVDASTITFSRTLMGRGGGDPITINYTGKMAGDELTLTPEAPAGGGGGGGGRGGGRGGGPVTLKRSK
jgi:hypothetical protein